MNRHVINTVIWTHDDFEFTLTLGFTGNGLVFNYFKFEPILHDVAFFLFVDKFFFTTDK